MNILSIGPKVKNLIVYYISATIATMAYKLMSSQYVDEGSHHRIFYHPYMQTFTMFLGETICLIIFFSDKKKHSLPIQEGKSSHNFTIFLIPSLADCCTSILQYIALNFITGSSYRMFQGASIITTIIFSKILINITIQKRHVWGCGLAFIGLLIVGGSGFIEPQTDTGEIGTEFLGYILMLISLIFMGYHYAYQQMLMAKHSISPLQMVGWQGFFGLIVILLVSLLFSIIPCNLGQNLCVYDNFDHMYLQRVDQFFIQFGSNWVVALLVVVATISISVTNLSGVTITKMFDALTYCLVSMSKTPVVWGIGLIITFSSNNDPDYQLESTNLTVNLVKIGGFFFIIIGTLIYNKLILKNVLADREENIHIQEDQSNQNRLKDNQI